MSQPRRVRFTVVAEGILLLAAGAIISLKATEWLADVWPNGHSLGRGWLLYAFAPLTAVSSLISGTLWTRRRRPSGFELFTVFVVIEFIAWRTVAYFYGAWFGIFVLGLWAIANVVFLPWWLLGVGIARALGSNQPATP
jgi:hypothetical protein